jgi:hypothetical protein
MEHACQYSQRRISAFSIEALKRFNVTLLEKLFERVLFIPEKTTYKRKVDK